MAQTYLAFFLVGLGGAAGSMLRYAVKLLTPAFEAQSSFPYATLLVNAVGSFFIGLLAAVFSTGMLASADDPWHRHRLLLMTGLLGGFTTFSSFALEIDELLRVQRPIAAAGYVVVSNLLCIGLAMIGYRLLRS